MLFLIDVVVDDASDNCTGGPYYMQHIVTQKNITHITNLHRKRPNMTVNWGIGS